jgi:hypothetical protein
MCDTCSVSAAQSSALQMQFDVSVLAKQQTAAKQSGEAIVRLIDAAAQLSKSIDTGTQFDGAA